MIKEYMIFMLSYILGSIPFSLIITKVKGLDLRLIGSGNIGATNVLRTTGEKYLAALALLLDSLKGFVVAYAAQQFFNDNLHIYSSSILAILGHMFPIWLKFKGGKGVATTLGVLLAFNIFITVIFILVWTIVFFIFRYSSLASLSAITLTLLMSFFFQKSLFLMMLVTAIFIFIKHYSNIKNLFHNKEHKWYKVVEIKK